MQIRSRSKYKIRKYCIKAVKTNACAERKIIEKKDTQDTKQTDKDESERAVLSGQHDLLSEQAQYENKQTGACESDQEGPE